VSAIVFDEDDRVSIRVSEPEGNPAAKSADRPADNIGRVCLGFAFEFVISLVDDSAAAGTDTPSGDTADADTGESTRA